jgi:hypothetical protein
LEHSLAKDKPDVCRELLTLAVEDAGGAIPDDFTRYHDKPGCTPFKDRSEAHAALFKARALLVPLFLDK